MLRHPGLLLCRDPDADRPHGMRHAVTRAEHDSGRRAGNAGRVGIHLGGVRLSTTEQSSPRSVTVTITAPSLSDAMDRAFVQLTTPGERVLEITDAALSVGDRYRVTAVVADAIPDQVR